jgi:hypothetical protein
MDVIYHLDEISYIIWMKSTPTIWMKSIPIDDSVGWGGVGWGGVGAMEKEKSAWVVCVRERALVRGSARERERERVRERERFLGAFGRWRSVVRCWTVAISVCKQSSSMR